MHSSTLLYVRLYLHIKHEANLREFPYNIRRESVRIVLSAQTNKQNKQQKAENRKPY